LSTKRDKEGRGERKWCKKVCFKVRGSSTKLIIREKRELKISKKAKSSKRREGDKGPKKP